MFHVIEPENCEDKGEYHLAGSETEVVECDTYLGVTLRHSEIAPDNNLDPFKSACKRLNLLKAVGSAALRQARRLWISSERVPNGELCTTFGADLRHSRSKTTGCGRKQT